MTRRETIWRGGQRAVPLAAFVITVALFVAALVLGVLGDRVSDVLPGLVAISFATVGAVILHQRPGNRIGWLLCAGSIPFAVLNTGNAVAYHDVVVAPGSLPGVRAVEAVINAMPLLGIGLLVAVLPQLFPNGEPVSRRWRPAVWVGWGFVLTGTISNVFIPEQVQGLPGVDNPTSIPSAEPVFSAIQMIALLCLVVSIVAGIAGLLVRWIRSRGDERQQLKWFIAGIAPVLVPMALHDAYPVVAGTFIALLLSLVPVTIGIAVLRYRLYDLDVVLNRVLVYLTLSAMTAAVYLALVVLAEVVIGTGQGFGVQVTATVVAAALFQPLRQRVQRGVDRLFFGDRARPYDALTRLGRTLEHGQRPTPSLATS